MYSIIISPQAQKQLKQLKQRYQVAFKLSLEDIRNDPSIGKPLTRELTGRYSYRVGVYRIVYKFNEKDKTIFILAAGHRSMVYK